MPAVDYASVEVLSSNEVKVHSTALAPRRTTATYSLRDTLKTFPNQSLWRYFRCDGNGEWIVDGLEHGTLVIAHDGSYMAEVDPNLCSAAYIIYCRR